MLILDFGFFAFCKINTAYCVTFIFLFMVILHLFIIQCYFSATKYEIFKIFNKDAHEATRVYKCYNACCN